MRFKKGEKVNMKFAKALAGVKKLFAAEIISIAAALLGVVVVILVAAANGNEGLIATGGTLGLVSGIALIVAFVITLVGLYQGGQDEVQVRYAFYFTILSVVLLVVATVMSSIQNDVVATIGKYVGIASNVSTVIALEYTLLGYGVIAKKKGSEEMYDKGRFLATCVLILFIVSIILDLYSGIMKSNAQQWVKNTVTIAGIVAAVAELAVYVLVVIYYYKLIKLLKK